MNDPELVDLCKAIYRKHREAIDLIVEYGASSKVLDVCEEKAIKFVGKNMVTRTANRVWFLPREMALFQTEMASGWGFLPKPYPVMWWFYYNKDKGRLRLTLEVGPIADSEYRIRLLKRIEESGFSFWKKIAFRKEAKFTQIFSVAQKVEPGDQGEADNDPEIVGKAAADLWEKGWSEGRRSSRC